MRLLIVATRFPYPIQKGDKLRLYHQLKFLSQHADLYLYSCSTVKVYQKDIVEIKKYVKEVKIKELKPVSLITNLIKTTATKLPFQVGMFTNSTIKKEVQSFAETHKIDHIYCQLIRMAENVADLPIPKTIDYMDAFGYAMDQRASMGGFMKKMVYKIEANRVKRYEKKIFDRFDAHTIITSQDLSRLDVPSGKVQVIANGVDTNFFTNKGDLNEFDIVFVGNMGYLPNIGAAKSIVEEIRPILEKKANKKFNILIAGARPSKEVIDLAKFDNVTIAGWMEDIRTAYRSGKIFVAPIFKGVGQQNKILEAMSMGVPCIVNDSVAKGLGLIHNKHCLIAETPEEFSNQILMLLESDGLKNKLVAAGKKLVQENFVWDTPTQKLLDLMSEVKP